MSNAACIEAATQAELPGISGPALTQAEFSAACRWLYETAGISLSPHKKALVASRLAKRLRHRNLASFGDYLAIVTGGEDPAETQIALDLLTTNETYFFREPAHFEFLREAVLPARARGRPFRVWSAACSTGEEPYSIAMVLADVLGANGPWEIVSSDISTRVMEIARRGCYPMSATDRIPPELLRQFALRGVGDCEGTFMVDEPLRKRVRIVPINLNATLPGIGEFDVVFLRNVMIYFDSQTKRAVVSRILARLRPGGHLFVSHSESLHGIDDTLLALRPSVYRKH
ncbi:MAG: protein-glutamate O-methyltransferase CheR [Gammaproteobacteria bacterium]